MILQNWFDISNTQIINGKSNSNVVGKMYKTLLEDDRHNNYELERVLLSPSSSTSSPVAVDFTTTSVETLVHAPTSPSSHTTTQNLSRNSSLEDMSCVLEQPSDSASASGCRSFEEDVLLDAMPSSSESNEASVNQHEKSEEASTRNDTSRLTPNSRDAPLVDTSNANSLTEYMFKITDQNGNVLGEPSNFSSNGEKQYRNKPIIHSEEEEIAFLRSLGWEENSDDDDEGLTPEEILDFCNKYAKNCRYEYDQILSKLSIKQ